MPLTPPTVAATLSTALAGVSMTGVGIPQFTLGVGLGVCQWTATTLVVTTVDVGTLGVGAGLLPCLVPQPLLLASLTTSFSSMSLIGTSSPQLILALANGLSLAFLQGLITTAHPTVGVGVGTASFLGPTSVPSMLAGFVAAGMTGTSAPQLASAIGLGLDLAFLGLKLAVPIVGAPAPSASTGVGIGKIL